MNRRHHKKSGNPPVAGSRFLPICWNCRGFLFAPRCGGANRHNSLRRIEFLYRISVRGRRRKKRESFGILRKLAVCPANAQTIKNRRQSREFYIFLWESQCVLELSLIHIFLMLSSACMRHCTNWRMRLPMKKAVISNDRTNPVSERTAAKRVEQ